MIRIILSIVIALIVVGHPVGATIIMTGPCDFETGGGFIIGKGSTTSPQPSSLPAGIKANFAVGGGIKNGALWGHLEYVDHRTSPQIKIHGTSVATYSVGDKPNERMITGTARVNGTDGFDYTVWVTDNAEPGRDMDEFSIMVDGYVAGFRYGDGPIAGGNIQLHPPNSNAPPPGKQACASGS